MSRSKKVSYAKDPLSTTVERYPSYEVGKATEEAESLMKEDIEKRTGKKAGRKRPIKSNHLAAPHVYHTAFNLLKQARMSTQQNIPPDLKTMVLFLRSGSAWIMAWALAANEHYEDPLQRLEDLDKMSDTISMMRYCCRVLKDLRVLKKMKGEPTGEVPDKAHLKIDDGGSAVSSLVGQVYAEIQGWRFETMKRILDSGGTIPVRPKAFNPFLMPNLP